MRVNVARYNPAPMTSVRKALGIVAAPMVAHARYISPPEMQTFPIPSQSRLGSSHVPGSLSAAIVAKMRDTLPTQNPTDAPVIPYLGTKARLVAAHATTATSNDQRSCRERFIRSRCKEMIRKTPQEIAPAPSNKKMPGLATNLAVLTARTRVPDIRSE